MSLSWSVTSWQGLPIVQQPEYRDQQLLMRILAQVRDLPEVVSCLEVEALKSEMSKCERGEQILLHCGDCSEPFSDCTTSILRQKLRAMYDFRSVLEHSSGKPVLLIGRIAGQFAKPRSAPYESVLTPTGQSINVQSYKGDNVNSVDLELREANPKRLLDGYFRSVGTMNYMRMHAAQEDIAPMFISHEGLLLAYESAMTRVENGEAWNLSTHFLWLGERTRKLGSAHVEYFRGIQNPVGMKVGPNANLTELVTIMSAMNPCNETGKLVLILRLGVKLVREQLPAIVTAVKASGIRHMWGVDPMHGNTFKTKYEIKTRSFADILSEVQSVTEILSAHGEFLSGLHLETASSDVTECLGGEAAIEESDLSLRYTTLCDPRLNVQQTEELLSKFGPSLKTRKSS